MLENGCQVCFESPQHFLGTKLVVKFWSKNELTFLVDEDTTAFNRIIEANRLPEKNEKETHDLQRI